MGCTCYNNPPCSWCVDMPEEICILHDKIRAKNKEIDALTRELKDMDSRSPRYPGVWNDRIGLKEELAELEKLDDYEK